jgi:hypothetical protein
MFYILDYLSLPNVAFLGVYWLETDEIGKAKNRSNY